MCLTTQYCSTLSSVPSGRRIIVACEFDASSVFDGPDDDEDHQDEFDETVVGNYMDEDDLNDAKVDSSQLLGDDDEEERPTTLFNGIIRWGFNNLDPSYQVEVKEGVESGSNHFLKNNTLKFYKSGSTTQTLDLLWNNIDVYYDPPHPGMEKYSDYNRTDDDCSTVCSTSTSISRPSVRHKVEDAGGYTLGDVRPVNSIVAFNLTKCLVNFCEDEEHALFVVESDAFVGLVLRYADEKEGGATTTTVKDDIYKMAEENVKRCARGIHANLKTRCERMAIEIVEKKIRKKKHKKKKKKGKLDKQKHNKGGNGETRGEV